MVINEAGIYFFTREMHVKIMLLYFSLYSPTLLFHISSVCNIFVVV